MDFFVSPRTGSRRHAKFLTAVPHPALRNIRMRDPWTEGTKSKLRTINYPDDPAFQVSFYLVFIKLQKPYLSPCFFKTFKVLSILMASTLTPPNRKTLESLHIILQRWQGKPENNKWIWPQKVTVSHQRFGQDARNLFQQIKKQTIEV